MTDSPFRFYLPASASAKWQAMDKPIQQHMFAEFLSTQPTVYAQSKTVLDYRYQSYVPGSFAKASLVAKARLITMFQLADQFSTYVVQILRKSGPVRGEIELTAEWAQLTSQRYKLEQVCSVGRIDVVLTDISQIVEAKLAGDWKHALGQVLAYRHCLGYNKWQSALLLLGQCQPQRNIYECCAHYDITVYWYSGNNRLCPLAERLLCQEAAQCNAHT